MQGAAFAFFLPAMPFPIHPAKQTVHFSPESLKPFIHTVCLEKQNRYSENALCFFLWMTYFVHIDV